MKKITGILILAGTIIWLASCEYDDSNDIDILTPNDSTETGVDISNLPE